MENKNVNATIREAYNVSIGLGETFTTSDLSTVSEVNSTIVSKYVYQLVTKKLCTLVSKTGRVPTYKKIGNDTTKTIAKRSKRINKPVVVVTDKNPNLNFKVEGTDAEIIDKLLPFVSNLKQMVIDLTDERNSLKDKNKELLSDNGTLLAEVNELRRNLPRLQEEVKEYRKIKAIRTVTI